MDVFLKYAEQSMYKADFFPGSVYTMQLRKLDTLCRFSAIFQGR